MKWTLRKRIVIPTILLSLTIVIITSLSAYFSARHNLEQAVDDQLSQLCQSGIREVQYWVSSQQHTLDQLANRATVQELATGRHPEHAKSLSRELAGIKADFGCYEAVHLVDAGGVVRASASAEAVDSMNLSDRAYFKAALQGKPIISDVITSRSTGAPVVVLANPIFNDGQVVGVMVGSLSLSWFSRQFVIPVKVGASGYAYITDSNGVVICHPSSKEIMTQVISKNDWGKQLLATRNGSMMYSFNGVTKYAGFRTSDTLGWMYCVTAPETEISAPSTMR